MKGMEILRLINTFYKHTDINVCTKTFYFQKAFYIRSFLKIPFSFDEEDLVHHEHTNAGKGFL